MEADTPGAVHVEIRRWGNFIHRKSDKIQLLTHWGENLLSSRNKIEKRMGKKESWRHNPKCKHDIKFSHLRFPPEGCYICRMSRMGSTVQFIRKIQKELEALDNGKIKLFVVKTTCIATGDVTSISTPLAAGECWDHFLGIAQKYEFKGGKSFEITDFARQLLYRLIMVRPERHTWALVFYKLFFWLITAITFLIGTSDLILNVTGGTVLNTFMHTLSIDACMKRFGFRRGRRCQLARICQPSLDLVFLTIFSYVQLGSVDWGVFFLTMLLWDLLEVNDVWTDVKRLVTLLWHRDLSRLTRVYTEQCQPESVDRRAIKASMPKSIPTDLVDLITQFAVGPPQSCHQRFQPDRVEYEHFYTPAKTLQKEYIMQDIRANGHTLQSNDFGGAYAQSIRELECFYSYGDFSINRDFFCVTVRVHESRDNRDPKRYGRGYNYPYLMHANEYMTIGLAVNHLNTPGQSIFYNGDGTLLLRQRSTSPLRTSLNNRYCETVQAMRVPPSDSSRRTKDGAIEPMTISVVLSNNGMWIIIDRVLYDFNVFSVLRGEDLPGTDMRSQPTDLLVPLIMSGFENRVEIVKPDASFDRVYIPGTLFTKPRELPVNDVSG